MGFRDRMKSALSHGWNAFTANEQRGYEPRGNYSVSGSWGARPDRPRLRTSNERSIIASIYTRLGIDAASAVLRHSRQDANGRFTATIKSGLNECLTVEANLDQGASAFRQDIFTSLFDKGAIAIVPVDVDYDPTTTSGYDIKSLRVAEIVDWAPETVILKLYNERTGKSQQIELPKRVVAIVENPFYAVMNEPNSTLQRIMRKLSLLDAIDEAAGSGKLDMIIQLPYQLRTDAKKEAAEQRRTELELQLKNSKYGIGYIDQAEHITQLNRPVENNMLKQIQYLMEMLYGQLGLTPSVFNGSANEEEMLNYHSRTIEPILRAASEAMARTFLTKTARSQGQTIMFFRDPFKLVPMSQIAEMADKFARNEIFTANEVRAIVGMMPSSDPNADRLVNSNVPDSPGNLRPAQSETPAAIEHSGLGSYTPDSSDEILKHFHPEEFETALQHSAGGAKTELEIPENASPQLRQHLLAQAQSQKN